MYSSLSLFLGTSSQSLKCLFLFSCYCMYPLPPHSMRTQLSSLGYRPCLSLESCDSMQVLHNLKNSLSLLSRCKVLESSISLYVHCLAQCLEYHRVKDFQPKVSRKYVFEGNRVRDWEPGKGCAIEIN